MTGRHGEYCLPLASALAGDELVPPVQRSGAAVLQVKAGPCGVPAREAEVSAVVALVGLVVG